MYEKQMQEIISLAKASGFTFKMINGKGGYYFVDGFKDMFVLNIDYTAEFEGRFICDTTGHVEKLGTWASLGKLLTFAKLYAFETLPLVQNDMLFLAKQQRKLQTASQPPNYTEKRKRSMLKNLVSLNATGQSARAGGK